MFNFLKNLFGGTKQDRDMKDYQPRVAVVNQFFQQYQSLSNDELRNKTTEFRERIADYLKNVDEEIASVRANAQATEDIFQKEGFFKEEDKLKKDRDQYLEEILLSILPEAFAVVKETARRFAGADTLRVTAMQHDRDIAARLVGEGQNYVKIEGEEAIWSSSWLAAGGEIAWNMVHYDVQLIGGMVLHDGKIAEMATGEGKTLVSTLPAYLNGVSGEGVHIVTVNDYLARRDAEWNRPVYEFLLLSVECIDKYQPNTDARRNAYKADIVYGTNNEFGFDYLRDNMVFSLDERVQGKHHFAMVDEVDSVLVDDARTPLIISGPVPEGQEEQQYLALKPDVERLLQAQQQIVMNFLNEAKKAFKEGKTGTDEGSAGLAMFRAYRGLPKYRPLIKFLSEEGVKVQLQKTENHFMQEQSKHMHVADEPLLFTIDEKNRNVELTERGAEYLAKSYGDEGFFMMPDLAGRMVEIDASGASAEKKKERKESLAQEFSIKSQRLHSVNQLLKAYTLFEKDTEYVIIENEVKIVDESTGRIMEGRRYSDGLHQALEAKENVKIGEITQTYATITLQNYFRMYHKLCGMTGTAETEAGEFWQIYKLDVVVVPTNRGISRTDHDDLVYKTGREKYNAVVEEIAKMQAAGRPVLVGTTSVEISETLSRFLRLRNIPHNLLNAKEHQREAQIISEAGFAGAVTIATNMAGRGTDIKLGAGVKEAGGLAIIGTERHDSRRVDRQLRGRAGRQGDPGSSQFFVSLEDTLMRLFQSERIAGMMDKLGHQEGEVIQHSMVTKSIERAQKKVEENNFGMRKRLLDYDDVMNIQREAIYKKRYNALSGERLALDLNTMFTGLVEDLVLTHKQGGNYESFQLAVLETLGMQTNLDANDFATKDSGWLIDELYNQFADFYERKSAQIAENILPLAKEVYENQGNLYRRIGLPFTDGRVRGLNVGAELADAVQTKGASIMRDIEKAVTLAILDDEWKEHLRNMDELKESVQGASFEQKDPLVIYKMEAYELFKQLVARVNMNVTSYLAKGYVAIQQQSSEELAADEARREAEYQRQQRQQQAAEEMRRRQALRDSSRQRTGGGAINASNNADEVMERPKPIIREAVKVGRNDACPCGSGKKYKNCHGQGA
ncbi:MAG: preprotein translocase, SecA subunit [Bacteroidota bacterium]|jgi:preprotein translocase subunit SecA